MLSRTKKFFKKSIQTFKSYFSEGYEKLPKSPSYDGCQNTGFSLINVQSEQVNVNEWEAKERVMGNEKKASNLNHEKPLMMIGYHDVRKEEKLEDKLSREREEKRCLVIKRLKELEFLDRSNVDHALDIQEVLYLYSRLTCPIYCEIVEKFSTEIYLEVFLFRPHNSKRMLV